MTAQVASDADGKVRVWCDLGPECPRPLDMRVETMLHAGRLAAKHDREHHPEPADPLLVSYDVTAAAQVYLRDHDAAAAAVWHALTGMRGAAAEEHARLVAAQQTTAHPIPF